MSKFAVIRISGNVNLQKSIKDTMSMLRLYRKHTCVVLPATKQHAGMIKKLKDFITWGEIDEETFKELLLKRGRLPKKERLTEEYIKEKTGLTADEFVKEFFEDKKTLKDIPGLKPFFKLSPPKKGFERGGVKKPYSMGGVLGYRKEKINELIKRML